ncbi:MAG: peptidyl-prolyl cis-trans isomerase [Steroidobacteraceae bacterium]
MLQKIGDAFTSRKWLTYILFGALAFIFAAWGAYGIATIQFTTGTNAAKVNGQTIPYTDVRQAWLQQQADWERRFGGAMPPAVKTQLEDQVLEQFIRETVIAQRTEKLGYRVSEQRIAARIRNEPAFQLEGQYSADVAKMRLQQAGITPEAFEQDLRQELRADQLQAGIQHSDFLTPLEVARLDALQTEEREIQYVVLPASEFASAAPLDEKSVQAYYDEHKAEFMSPESVHLQYAELDVSQVASQIQVADADLRDYYDKHKSQYVLPERRRARHILIAVTKSRDDAAALKRADEVLAKLKAGASFAVLAKQYSDDSGSASQGGDLGWADHSSLGGALADAVFAMKADEVRGPVKSQFGYHIIQLESIEPGKTRTFDEVRAEITPTVRHDEANDRFGDIQEQIQQQLDDGTPTLEGLAKSFGMKLGEIAQFDRGTGGAPLGSSHDLQDAVFSDSVLAEHRIGGPILIGDSELVLVRALDHHMPSPKPLDQVRDTIVATLRKERANEAAVAAAQAAVRKLESGAAFASAVQGLGVTAEPPHFVGRTDPSVPTQIRDVVFESSKPAQGKPVFQAITLDSGGAAVLALTDVREGAGAAADAQRLTSAERQQVIADGTQTSDDYLEQLLLTAKVKKNLGVFDQQ